MPQRAPGTTIAPRRRGSIQAWSMFAFLLLIAWSATTAKAEVEESVRARIEPSTLHLGEVARIAIEVFGEGAVDPELLDLPAVDGVHLEIESGPTLERGDDGALFARFVVLARPLTAGERTIPGFEVKVRSDDVLATESVRLRVEGAKDSSIEFEVKTETPRAFANEPFTLVLRIVRPADALPTLAREIRLPWLIRALDLEGPGPLLPEHEVYDIAERGGRVYFAPEGDEEGRLVLEARMTLLSPEAGRLDFSGTVLCIDPRTTKDASDPSGGGSRIEVPAPPASIEIRPWPAGAPSEFVDAVGDFDVVAALEPRKAGVGELMKLSITVSRAGERRTNLKTSNFAHPFEIDGFRVYARHDERSLDRLVMHLDVAATRADVVAVPPIRFAWLDPRSGEYAGASTSPLSVEITRSETPTEPVSDVESEAAALPELWRSVALGLLLLVVCGLLLHSLRSVDDSRRAAAEIRNRDMTELALMRANLERLEDPYSLAAGRAVASAIARRCDRPAAECFGAAGVAALRARGASAEVASSVAAYFERVEERSFAAGATATRSDRELFASTLRAVFEQE